MRRILPIAVALAGLLLPVVRMGPSAQTADRAVAVTFDDLPATPAGSIANDVATLNELTRKLLTALGKYKIPAIGFVNEGKLFHAGGGREDLDGRTGVLRMWTDAGLELGNHTYSHRDLNNTPLEGFQADVIRGEVVTRRLLDATPHKLRYFRHPFLHVGADLQQRRAFETFLAGRGYAIAPVTIDNDDFLYAAAYASALRRGDSTASARIAEDYVRYMSEVFEYFEAVSRRVVGREIRHVLLVHANSLNADHFGAVAEALVRRGYRFISLEHALEDEAYRRPDDFVGAPGNSWLNHWEITAGRKPVPTPAPPDWILRAASSR